MQTCPGLLESHQQASVIRGLECHIRFWRDPDSNPHLLRLIWKLLR